MIKQSDWHSRANKYFVDLLGKDCQYSDVVLSILETQRLNSPDQHNEDDKLHILEIETTFAENSGAYLVIPDDVDDSLAFNASFILGQCQMENGWETKLYFLEMNQSTLYWMSHPKNLENVIRNMACAAFGLSCKG